MLRKSKNTIKISSILISAACQSMQKHFAPWPPTFKQIRWAVDYLLKRKSEKEIGGWRGSNKWINFFFNTVCWSIKLLLLYLHYGRQEYQIIEVCCIDKLSIQRARSMKMNASVFIRFTCVSFYHAYLLFIF